jgi:hypothetical protein
MGDSSNSMKIVGVVPLATVAREYDDTATRLRVRESKSTDFQQVETRLGLGRAQLLAAQGRARIDEVHYADARNNGGVPLLTPMVRALDGIGRSSQPKDRSLQDTAAPMKAAGASVETE